MHIYNEGAIFPGDILKGKVCINVFRAGERVDDEAIELRLLGWEYTAVGTKYYRSQNITQFLDASYSIIAFEKGKTLTTGKYEFPFQIPLDPGLKPNIVNSVGNFRYGEGCKIGYRVEVRVRGPKTGNVWIKVFSKGLKITGAPTAQLPDFNPQIVTPLVPVKIASGNGGWVVFAASLSKLAVQIDEEFKVSYYLLNYSSSNLNLLTIEIKETVTWKERVTTRTIYSRGELPKDITMPVHSKLREVNSVKTDWKELNDKYLFEDIKNQLDSHKYGSTLKLQPKSVRADFTNFDISVTHEVTITFHMEQLGPITINLPLVVFASSVSVERKAEPSSPKGWRPTYTGPEAIYPMCGYKNVQSYAGDLPSESKVDPTFPAVIQYSPTDAFSTFLNSCNAEKFVPSYCHAFRRWLDATVENNLVEHIQPAEIHTFLSKLRNRPIEQFEVIELFLARRLTVTCSHLQLMYTASLQQHRMYILQQGVVKCIDPENRGDFAGVMSRYEYYCVQEYFKKCPPLSTPSAVADAVAIREPLQTTDTMEENQTTLAPSIPCSMT